MMDAPAAATAAPAAAVAAPGFFPVAPSWFVFLKCNLKISELRVNVYCFEINFGSNEINSVLRLFFGGLLF